MRFDVYGPYDLPRTGAGLIDHSATAKRRLWSDMGEDVADACGCYVFAVKAPKGTLPWYVGLTTRRSFRHECLGAYQVNCYNSVIAQRSKGKPQLFLIAKYTPQGRFAKPSRNGHKVVEFLETYLIALALRRNPSLVNKKSTKFLKNMQVPGVLNNGKGALTVEARSLKRSLGV